jgi:protein-S-isoprenylcysteine O-methyltransferase Ste14
MLLGVALRYVVAPAPVPVARMISVTGGLIVLGAGIVLAFAAEKHFIRTGQSPMPWTPSPELILQGPYRFTRNPMYVGMTLAQIGIGLAVNSLWIAGLALVTLLVIHFTAVLPEERYLAEKFGDSYEALRRKVRRYL